ncbi:MAG: PepSY-associated TM helix domain-containing protein [Bacteroidota bacterium]
METLSRPTRTAKPQRTSSTPPPSPKKSGKLVGPRAFKLLWDTHSVTGIIIGLGLFIIFYAGAFALYRAELHAWADPALRASETRLTADEVIAPFFAEAPPSPGTDVQITYPYHERSYYYVRYQTPEGDTTRVVQALVNAETGASFDVPVGETLGRSALSELLYRLHFFYQAGFWGQLIAGLVAVFFLLTVVSGVLIHLRKLPKDWHTFRPKVKLRSALADAHTVLGLIGLPFAAMYAITGAFLALLVILLAPTVIVVFGGDQEAAFNLVYDLKMPEHEPTGVPAEMLSFAEYEAALPDSWGDGTVETTLIIVHGYGDENAIADVYGDATNTITAAPRAILKGSTAELLVANNPTKATPLGGTTSAITNLHYARLGTWAPLAKVLYFLLALATAAVILTGNILWVLVRRPKDPRATPKLHRFLARLTIGVGCGLVLAVPILFLTTQLLPIDMDGLKTWENRVFFGVWAALLAAAFAGPTAIWAARWQLWAAGVLSLLVPLASGALGGTWPWIAASNGWWGILTIDVGFVLMGLALLWTARRLRPDALTLAPSGDGDGAAIAAPLAPHPAVSS